MTSFDKLQLFRGKDYKVNDYITIHHPTLEEICEFGEAKYFNVLSCFVATPSNFKVQLDDMGVDYTKISEYELFLMFCGGLTPDSTSIFFGDELDFSSFRLYKNKETGEPILYHMAYDYVIDKVIATIISSYLRTIHFIERKVDIPGNANTRKYIIDSERRRQNRMRNRPYESMLVDLVSAMVNCEQFKYNHKTIWQLPVYTFYDSVRRIQKIKDCNYMMQGIYAGTVDPKKIPQDKLDWMGSIER